MQTATGSAGRPAGALGAWLGATFARPASARPLAALRIGLALVLLYQALALRDSLTELFGSRGIVQLPLVEGTTPTGLPRVRWVVEALAPLGLGEPTSLRVLLAAYLSCLVGLLLGWRTRAMALAVWLIHLAFKTSSHLSAYGVYEFAHIALFYCVGMPVGHAWSLDVSSGRVSGEPTPDARLGLRVLQLHLCVVYLSSGIEKARGEQWWNGEAVWRALMREDLGQYDFAWLAQAPWLAMLACWGTLLVELGYALFVWPRRTRAPMALATVGLHLGIGVFLGLWSFAALMIVLTVAAFLVSPEPAPAPAREGTGVPKTNPEKR